MNSNWKTNYTRYRTLFLNLVGRYKEREDLKVYLELFLSLATVVTFAVFALRPTLLTISSLIKEIEAKQETIDEMDDKIADLIAAQRAYDQNRQNIDLLMTAIPTEADPEIILRQVEGVIIDSQVNVREMEMGEMIISSNQTNQPENKSTKDNTSPEVPIVISTTSEYTNLLNFIQILEGMRKPFDIKRTEFDYSTEEEGASLILTVEAGLPIIKKNN